VIVALWAFFVEPARPAGLEFRVEAAGIASEAVAAPPDEVVPAPDPEIEPVEVVAAAAPTDEPVAEELPELEAPAETATVAWTVSVPSPSARLRRPEPAPAAEPAPAPPSPPAAPPPTAERPASVASAGAARVERASPLASNQRPAYPAESRRLGEQGTVALLLTLGTDGSVVRVALESSSGSPRLDEAAVSAAWGWRFRPATRDGVPVVTTVRQRVGFRLDQP
jgi:protein TonB